MPRVNLFQSLANFYGYAAAAYGWGEVKETKGANSGENSINDLARCKGPVLEMDELTLGDAFIEDFCESVRGNELVSTSKSDVQASPDASAATDGLTTIPNDVLSHTPSTNACQQPASNDDEAVNVARVSQQPVATVNDAPFLRSDEDLGPGTKPTGDHFGSASIDEAAKSERGLGMGDVMQNASIENVDRNVSDTETSTTDYSSDSASFVGTVVELMEGPSSEIKAGVDVAAEDVNELVKVKDMKDGAVEEIDSSAASIKPVFAFKSWAEVMAEYQAEKKRALEAWEVENTLLMDSTNTGAAAWYDTMTNAEQGDESFDDTTASMSIPAFKDFCDEIAQLSRELDTMRPKERVDWGPKRDALMPLGDKPQSSAQSRTTSKYLQFAGEVGVVSETTKESSEGLAGYGQLFVEGFARPRRMRAGRGRQGM